MVFEEIYIKLLKCSIEWYMIVKVASELQENSE